MINRFYEIGKGQLKIDDIPVNQIKKTDLYQLTGLLPSSILFNDSVHNNIALGESSSNKKDVVEAAIIANAYEFIKELNDGFDTVIGEVVICFLEDKSKDFQLQEQF